MSTAFNTNEGTNLVRVLIWKGAVELVAASHAHGFTNHREPARCPQTRCV